MCAKFQEKQTTLTFLVQICSKMDFGVGIRNQHLQDTMCTNFQSKIGEIAQLRAIFWC